MALSSAMEDYLEAVFMLQKRKGYVRCVDVADQLGVKKAFGKPGGQGIVQIRPYHENGKRHTLPNRTGLAACRADL